MKKIETKNAPNAIGAYSQAVSIPSNSNLIFVSGQLPIDVKTNRLIKDDIQLATKTILDNIEQILLEANSSLSNVIKIEIFMTNLELDFQLMNEEYQKRFQNQTPPARQTIGVLNLPKGATIEISCIAKSN